MTLPEDHRAEWLCRAIEVEKKYGGLALQCRVLHEASTGIQVVCAALVPVAALGTLPWNIDTKVVTAFLGAAVAMAKGLDSALGWRTSWSRAAMTRERATNLRLNFETGTGPFAGLAPEVALQTLSKFLAALVDDELQNWTKESGAAAN